MSHNGCDNGASHTTNIFRTILSNDLLATFKRYTKTDLAAMYLLDEEESVELFFFIRNTDFANLAHA